MNNFLDSVFSRAFPEISIQVIEFTNIARTQKNEQDYCLKKKNSIHSHLIVLRHYKFLKRLFRHFKIPKPSFLINIKIMHYKAHVKIV